MDFEHWFLYGGIAANGLMAIWNLRAAQKGVEHAKMNLTTCKQNGEIIEMMKAQRHQDFEEFNKLMAALQKLYDRPTPPTERKP